MCTLAWFSIMHRLHHSAVVKVMLGDADSSPPSLQLQCNQGFEAEQVSKSHAENATWVKRLTSHFWPILMSLISCLWICNQILMCSSCEPSWSPALQHNRYPVLRNTSWIMFHETAPVTSEPSDRRKGERAEDVLLAGLLASCQAYMHTGR